MTVLRATSMAAAVACLAGGAAADITYTAQGRTLFARAGYGGTVSDSRSAPDFGPYTDTLEVRPFPAGDEGYGKAYQNSRLDPLAIIADGYALAGDGLQTSMGQARSTVDVLFSIPEATSFHIAGSWNVRITSTLATKTTVRLTTTAGDVVFESVSDPFGLGPPSFDFDEHGMMPAGDYRLFIEAFAYAQLFGGFSEGSADYDVTLTIPAPASLACAGAGLLAFRRRR